LGGYSQRNPSDDPKARFLTMINYEKIQGMMLNEKRKKMNDIYTGLIPLKLN
jgi:hypothetical protein